VPTLPTPQSRVDVVSLAKQALIHSFGMKCAIDVLYLDNEGLVVKTEHLKPMRVAAPVGRSKTIVEMPSGSIERFDVRVGDFIEVRSA
jgi:uncharacterized membrane protein (UPF0127 family)